MKLSKVVLYRKKRLIFLMIESVAEKEKTFPSVPYEINAHLKRFGKESWEVNYDLFGYCDMCNSRIDEFGYCACGGAAD